MPNIFAGVSSRLSRIGKSKRHPALLRAGAGGSIPSVESKAMRRAKDQSSLVRSVLTAAVISMIALLLVLSIAITSSVGHGFDQITLALPIFFVLLFLATSIGDWFQIEDFLIEAKPRLSSCQTRAPPA
jgi:hypothetical protein